MGQYHTHYGIWDLADPFAKDIDFGGYPYLGGNCSGNQHGSNAEGWLGQDVQDGLNQPGSVGLSLLGSHGLEQNNWMEKKKVILAIRQRLWDHAQQSVIYNH